MKLIFKIFFLSVSILQFHWVGGQDIHFSQFYEQPMLRNPALAGIYSGDIRVISSYRNQWQSVTTPYRTFSLSSEVKIPLDFISEGDHFSIGLQLAKDVAGTSNFSKTMFLPVFNYHKLLNEENNTYLSGAIMGGFVQQQFDPTKLILNDQFSLNANGTFNILSTSQQTFERTNVTYPELSAGVSFSSQLAYGADYYIGLGFFNLTKPKLFFSGNEIQLNPKFALNAGLAIATSDINELILYGDYFRQGGHNSFQGGLLYGWDFFTQADIRNGIRAGAFYRWNDAFIPVIQLELNKIIIGVSYDANVSKLVTASQYRGGLEVTLSYRNFLNVRNKALMGTRCPKFGFMPTVY